MTGLSTGISAGQVNIYNLNAQGGISVNAGTGAWDVIQGTTRKTTVRFTGTSLSGTSGNVCGIDSFIIGSRFFLNAEL
jgi:hypothetical protein